MAIHDEDLPLITEGKVLCEPFQEYFLIYEGTISCTNQSGLLLAFRKPILHDVLSLIYEQGLDDPTQGIDGLQSRNGLRIRTSHCCIMSNRSYNKPSLGCLPNMKATFITISNFVKGHVEALF